MTKIGIVLLHGFYSSPLFMKSVEQEFNKTKLFDQVLNLSLYGPRLKILSESQFVSTPIININENDINLDNTLIANVLSDLILKLNENISHLMLVGHSLGGVVWRALYKSVIAKNKDNWLGRKSPKITCLIQLASPNQGTKLTNIAIASIVDNIHSMFYLRRVGLSNEIIKKIKNRVGLNLKSIKKIEIEGGATQIKQLSPNSEFINWLNEDPNYIEDFPHYRMIGTRNSFYLTNYAWNKIDNITKIMDLNDDDIDMNEIENELKSSEDINEEISDESILKLIKSTFIEKKVIPNDGVVSIEDSKLDGSILIELDGLENKVSHHNMCLWFLPFKPYSTIKKKVLEVINTEINKIKR